ncbi:TonB-dependent receptor [Shewanella ulleungensis]|uniref:TonB-dependent receptor n=1 Tax=Shewanella ulleungensis TaxID=2282699 RepID=A0ABQ2QL76_9GAMM|nr:TonB-dependent receptor [Shewanella ulleungensis]MCL1150091.1 TonB-dependent receptor [Shewanella ulleungensis]GGP86591.1 TonB-dependent receptor [Shewanella ulleungensis]
MKKTTLLRSACAIAVSLSFAPVSFIAQAADDAQAKVERIEVTGSRIKRTDIEGPSPVQSLSKDDIANMGFDNLQQLLERMPANGSGAFSTRGNSQDSTANGGASISLRGLGPDATLVLINGRRVGSSAFAEGISNSFVDINNIPVSAIERIDILKDGASAIYGSDAIAGVVNIVLKKDIEGIEINLGYGDDSGTGYDETTASLVWGVKADKGSASIILDYFTNGTLSAEDMGRFGTANQSPYGGEDYRSSRGYPGYFYVNGVKTIDPDCPADSATASGSCLFDYGPYNMTIPTSERVGAIGQFDYMLGEDLTAFLELSVQHNTSEAGGAPTPLDEDAGLTVPGSHPNNPFADDAVIDIGRYRTVDAGARRWDIESDTMRIVAGLRGVINDWDWEVSAQRGRSESTQTGDRSQGWVRTDYLQAEIDAGNYNPFGGVTNSQDVIDRITTSLVRQGKSSITAYDASITGQAFTIADRDIMMAAGAEYREESVSDVPDEQFQRGLIFGTEAISAFGSRDQHAAYVEFSIPMTDSFELQLAGRYDSYSDFGSTTNPKIAFQWGISDELTARGSWSTGFRAPSLAQIGLGPSEKSDFLVDSYRCAADNVDCELLDYNFIFAGNPDLDAEESETWNVGMIWAPSQQFDIGFDLFNIVQDNKIDSLQNQDLYDEHCGDQNSTVCLRNAPQAGETFGTIDVIKSGFVNIGSQEVQGLDLSTHYALELNNYGDVKFGLEYSYLISFEKEIDGETIDYTGEYEYPQHRWLATTNWMMDDFAANVNLSYIGEFEDYNKTRTVDAQLLVDMSGSYRINDMFKLSVGVNNVFDEEPSFAIGDGDADLYGYAMGVHNPLGRYVYTKVTMKF